MDTIHAAHGRIRPFIHRTPVLTCATLDDMVGARLFFKCENLQKAGAFKSRGACNAVFSLADQEAARGVVTHSSGNHAAALSRAARLRGAAAYIVMPRTAPLVKQEAVRGYGGKITFCEPTLAAREQTAEQVIHQTGAAMVHPYNDDRIIAGQGTAALELLEQTADLDMILAPLGGGGLLSGTLIATKETNRSVRVFGCELAMADDAYRSLQAGRIVPSENPDTIADGLRTSLGDKTFPIIRDLVDGIVLAEEDAIVSAMRLVFERMKIVVEPSAVVPLAVLLSGGLPCSGRRVGVILSGGNVDVSRLPFSAGRSNQ